MVAGKFSGVFTPVKISDWLKKSAENHAMARVPLIGARRSYCQKKKGSPMTTRKLQTCLALIFLLLGAWCLLAPGMVIRLAF